MISFAKTSSMLQVQLATVSYDNHYSCPWLVRVERLLAYTHRIVTSPMANIVSIVHWEGDQSSRLSIVGNMGIAPKGNKWNTIHS